MTYLSSALMSYKHSYLISMPFLSIHHPFLPCPLIILMNSMEFDPNQKWCQSCAMPMNCDTDYGTESNGELSTDYCKYCYMNGAFVDAAITMEEMSEFCAKKMDELQVAPYAQAKEMMDQALPHLKRWAAE